MVRAEGSGGEVDVGEVESREPHVVDGVAAEPGVVAGVDAVAVAGDAGVGVEGVGLGDSGGVDGPVAGCGGVAAVGDYC